MIRRRRFKQTTSLENRLIMDAKKSRERARKLPPGKERDTLLENPSRRGLLRPGFRRIGHPFRRWI